MAIDLGRRLPEAVARPRRDLRFQVPGVLRVVVTTVLRWREVRRQRRALLTLSDELLKDIGISRADAMQEAGRPFWEDPESWRGWR